MHSLEVLAWAASRFIPCAFVAILFMATVPPSPLAAWVLVLTIIGTWRAVGKLP